MLVTRKAAPVQEPIQGTLFPDDAPTAAPSRDHVMNNLRFVVLALGLFAAAFGGISWAARGFPVMGWQSAPGKPEPQIAKAPASQQAAVAARPAAPAASAAKPDARLEFEHSKILQSDPDAGRRKMRLTAIEAANDFAVAPCNLPAKAAFIVATSTYLNALNNKQPTDARIATMDARVRAVIRSALEAGGVNPNEFPAGTQAGIASIAGPSSEMRSPCAPGRQAERLER